MRADNSRPPPRDKTSPGKRFLDGCLLYADTVHLLLPNKLTLKEKTYLQRVAGGRKRFHASKPTPMSWQAGYQQSIQLQRPTASFFEAFNRLGIPYVICRLDIAADFECADGVQRDRIHRWCRSRLVIRAGKAQPIYRLGVKTTYFARRTSYRGLTLYDDKLSKVAGVKCVHLEARLVGSAQLRRLKIETAADLTGDNLRRVFEAVVRVYSVPEPFDVKLAVDRVIELEVNEQLRQRRRKLGYGSINTEPEARRAITFEVRERWRYQLFGPGSSQPVYGTSWGRAPVTNLLAYLPEIARKHWKRATWDDVVPGERGLMINITRAQNHPETRSNPRKPTNPKVTYLSLPRCAQPDDLHDRSDTHDRAYQ